MHSFSIQFFHSVSQGFVLVEALPIGSSAPTVQSYTLSYTLGVKSESGSESRSKKKNDLGKVSRNFFSRYQIGLRPWFSAVVHSDFLTWLTCATIRFFSLAEQCYTLIF